jgi:Family of unknown function (DUF6173)
MNPNDFSAIAGMQPIFSTGMEAMQKRKADIGDSTIFLADFHRASLASAFVEKILRRIAHFDASLDTEHEVGVKLVTFGQTVTFHVQDVKYHNPSLLVFQGVAPEGHRVELIQNVSQISFLLIALPKSDPSKPKRPFGFHMPAAAEPFEDPPQGDA